MELPRVAARRWRQGHLHPRRPGRDHRGPRQGDRQDDLEEQGARRGRGTGRRARPTSASSASGAAYASAIAIDFDGQRQYVQLTAKALVGVAASDGKFLWRYDKPANGMGINCSTPLYHDGQVFAASAYGAGGGLVKLSKDGRRRQGRGSLLHPDDAEPPRRHDPPRRLPVRRQRRQRGRATSSVSTSRPARFCGTSEPAEKGSVALADGRLYYRTENGTVLLIEPSAKEYVERGRFKQPDRSRPPAWAHPVIANGKLYIRDQDVLLCYDVKAK